MDRRKLPNGLDGLSKKLNEMGLKFGLWFEPEMVSPNSELYKNILIGAYKSKEGHYLNVEISMFST